MEPGVYEYTGAWAEGKISGKGNLKQGTYTVKMLDGTERIGEYEGEVLNGLPEGQGIFYSQNSKGDKYYYEGEWKNGLWNGQGKTVHESGKVREGRYENCSFIPTPLELFTAYFNHFNCSICANAQEFINANEDLFYKDVADIPEELLDKDFEIEKFKENPNSNIKGIVESNNLTVTQTEELDADPINFNFPKGIISLILAQDEQKNNYFYFIVGRLPESVAEGSNIKLSAIPVNYFAYKNINNEDVWGLACAAVKID